MLLIMLQYSMYFPSQAFSSLTFRADAAGLGKSLTSVAGYPLGAGARKDSQMKRPARVPGHGSKGKLHSTVLNATMTDIPAPKSVSSEFRLVTEKTCHIPLREFCYCWT